MDTNMSPGRHLLQELIYALFSDYIEVNYKGNKSVHIKEQ